MKSESVYQYYNSNPRNVRTSDCYIRAIAAGTGDSWQDTAKGLFNEMMNTGFVMGSIECYGNYLKRKGWVQCKQLVKSTGKKVRLNELAQKFTGKCILHAGSGHIGYIDGNRVYDIWDCSNEIAGICFVPKEDVAMFESLRKEF